MVSLTSDTVAVGLDVCLSLGLSESGKKVPEFPRVLSLLSLTLERTVQKNEELQDSIRRNEIVSVFHGLRAPHLSIKRYIERIFKYSKCSPSCFVLAQIYIDRFLERKDVHLTSFNVHRLLVTSVVIAAKFIDDAFFDNAYYAKVGGVPTVEMNNLELNFLFSLDFRLHVDVGTFERYCMQLVKEAMGYHVERPMQVCRLNKWANIEETHCKSGIQRYSCGAV